MTSRSSSHRLRMWTGRAALLAGALLVLAACGDDARNEISPLDPKGDVAERQIGLLEFWMVPAALIGIGVLVATVALAIKFRERPGNENPRQTHGNTTLEIGWTIVPALIMAAMAVPTVALIWDLDASSADLEAKYRKTPLEVTVYGKQWWWEYQYTNLDELDDSIDYQVNTANELHIPAERPVHFTLKSDNVIHSFWVPSLAGKKDVVPGRDNTVWFIAEADDVNQWFYGQCVEYCGLSHADMRLKVKVHAESDFIDWAKGQNDTWSAERVAKAGELGLTTKWGCVACHYMGGTDAAADAAMRGGEGAGTRRGPNLTHLGDRTTIGGAKIDLLTDDGKSFDIDKLSDWIFNAGSLKPNQCDHSKTETDPPISATCVGMPNFSKEGMTPEEARAIAEFLVASEDDQ